MLAAFLMTASLAFGAPDSLRLLQLEAKLAHMEAEKAREAQERAEARIAALENEVQRMAASRPPLDNFALWNAGEKLQTSIWLQVTGLGLSILGGVGAASENEGLALVGTLGGLALSIGGIVQVFGAGSELKRAASIPKPEIPRPRRDSIPDPLDRARKAPHQW